MRLGTRGSPLAVWQARTVARLLLEAGGPACEIVTIRTSGDEAGTGPVPNGDTPPASVKSLFVKELEEALLDRHIDIAVHSSKDMPAALPGGLVIGATLPREDPRDAIVLPSGQAGRAAGTALTTVLGPAPRIGTSSVRRAAQLGALFTRATFAGIRGNVETRLRKLDHGDCDAIVLASAGLRRLGLTDRISYPLSTDVCTPSPGQGIIAVEHAEDRPDVTAALRRINDADAADALAAERAVVRALGGGCQMPIGALAYVTGSSLSIDAVVIAPDGVRAIRRTTTGPRVSAVQIGESLARALLESGAGEILDAVRRAQP